MKNIFIDIAGGVAVCVLAAVVGIAHNAVRERPLPLIQSVKSASVTNDNHETQSSGAQAAEPRAGDKSSDDGAVARQEAISEGSVSADQVKAMLEDSNVVIIDARSPEEFDEGRVPSAINVPYDQLPEYYQQLITEIPLDALVVCYCQGPDCDFSHELATELRIMGFMNVVLFTGGWEHWEAAGYPIEDSN